MLKDFDSSTLPTDGSHTYDTSQSKKLSPSTWPHIFGAGTSILLDCLKGATPRSGWIKVNDDIAVLVLPASSLMRFYWANEMATGFIHISNQTAALRGLEKVASRFLADA